MLLVLRRCFCVNALFKLRHGSNECDNLNIVGSSQINSEAAQEGVSELIFHRLDCSKLSHRSELTVNLA
jgi:hypothetical protein